MEELIHTQICQHILFDSSKYFGYKKKNYDQEVPENQQYSIQLKKFNSIYNKVGNHARQNKNNIKEKQSNIMKKTIRKYPKQIQQKEQKLSLEQHNIDNIQDNIQIVINQTSILQQIREQPIQQQIQILHQEIHRLDNNNNLTNNQKCYYRNEYQKQLFAKLKDQGEVKSIPHLRQNIEASNPELMLYVLKEQLLRDQNRELLTTSKLYSFGFDSIVGAYGQDQFCLKVRNTNLDFDKIVNDKQLLQQQLLEFKQNLSSSLNISFDQIEILGVSKGSFEINFQITGKNIEAIQQEIQNNHSAQQYLMQYCNGNVEYLAYFNCCSQYGKGTLLSSDDFNPQYNKSWDGYNQKVQRGPPYQRYDYYYPRGCVGFGLNLRKYGQNQDWLKKDGNPNEWRIMYHGTRQQYLNSIVKNGLQSNFINCYADDECLDQFGNKQKVGQGIYFTDNIVTCTQYIEYTQVCNKQFAVIFMSRVYPKQIKQSQRMKEQGYFLLNYSQDIRPYRILLFEKK